MTLDQSEKIELQEEEPAQAPQKRGLGKVIAAICFVLAAAIGYFVYMGITSRTASAAALVQETKADSALAVAVTHPKFNSADEEVVLPGNIQAFTDSPIYARTSGYLKKWYADIGTH